VAGETDNTLGISVGKSLGMRKEMERRYFKMGLMVACRQEQKIRDLIQCHVAG
jgi:hypothetical protein